MWRRRGPESRRWSFFVAWSISQTLGPRLRNRDLWQCTPICNFQQFLRTSCLLMLLNGLDHDVFKPFRSHRRLLGWNFRRVLEGYRFQRGFLHRDTHLREHFDLTDRIALINASQKVKRIKRFFEPCLRKSAVFCGFQAVLQGVAFTRAVPSAGLSCYWKGNFVTSTFEPCFQGIWASDFPYVLRMDKP